MLDWSHRSEASDWQQEQFHHFCSCSEKREKRVPLLPSSRRRLPQGAEHFHNQDPIKCIYACRTHARTHTHVLWGGKLRNEAGEGETARQVGISQKEVEWKGGPGVGRGGLGISYILHSTFCTGRGKCNYTCPLSLFRQVWCVGYEGWALGPPAVCTPHAPYANKCLFCILTDV